MSNDLCRRTQRFALAMIRVVESLPRNPTTAVLGKQLIRCGTSVGANFRAAQRAKSPADFINKLKIVEEEADESLYWLDLLVESGHLSTATAAPHRDEANQLVAIIVSSINKARGNTK